MLLQELRAEFNEYFQTPSAQLVLWLDLTAQWKGVAPQLADQFHVVTYRGSQLEVKAAIELAWARKERPRFVLYLPGLSRDGLNVLKEYEFFGKVFEESIVQALRRWGVEFDRAYEPELERILPIAAPHLATKSRTFWQAIRTPQNLRALLFDEESVRKMLASPEGTLRELQNAETFEAFCDFLAEEYGGPLLRDLEPAKWVVQFTGYLILTEVRSRTAKPSNFPAFDVRWADDRREATCLAFLRDLLRNASYKDDFKRLSRQAEETYNLSAWVAGLSELTDAESSLKVELIGQRGMIGKIDSLKSLQELKEYVKRHGSVIGDMAPHFWSQEGEVVIWRALSLAREIFEKVDLATPQINGAETAETIVHGYMDGWWQIDRLYRSYRAQYDGEDKLSELSHQLRSFYREYLVALNEKFVSLLSYGSKGVDLRGVDPQGEFWNKSVGKRKKKRAVMFVDALRYELAMDLAERLKRGLSEATISCEALRAAVPSLTDLGMPALLPVEGLSVSVGNGQWDVHAGKESGNLASRAERKRYLQKRYPKAAFFDMADTLSGGSLEVKDTPLIVVFTEELDASGHDSGVLNLSLDFFGQYLDGLARAARRLGGLGVEEIHLVSDHGFLLLDDLREADQVPLDDRLELAYQGHRCLVGRDLPDTLGVVFGLPGSDGLKVAFPRGIGVFRTRGSKEFLHGGLSLHELLVPHLTVTFKRAEPKYGAKLRAPDAIRNLIFEVDVLRATPVEGGLFGSPRFLEIVGSLMGDEKPREVFKEAGADMVIDQAHDVLTVRLRIKPGSRHRYGEMLRLELKDADTGEPLDSAELLIEVESDE